LQALTGLAPFDGLDKADADLSFVSARAVTCTAPSVGVRQLRVQADGELLGPAPTEISIIPKALTLLIAPEAQAAAAAQSGDPL
jgi:diacylglycerol kinase family enzyme